MNSPLCQELGIIATNDSLMVSVTPVLNREGDSSLWPDLPSGGSDGFIANAETGMCDLNATAYP
jgi:hypothetical protein